jgi:hypothetical protein
MTRVVGVGGRLRHGKDAVADRLVDAHGWVKFGMSDPLATAAYTLNPWILMPTALGWKNRFTAFLARVFRVPPRPVFMRYQQLQDMLGYVGVKEYEEARRILQVLGTEVGRKQFDENFWVDLMVKNVRKAIEAGAPGVIVTGVRFPNELDAIMDELDGETWWVHRPALAETASAAHASENSVNAVDFERVVVNDGTLEDLYRKVDALVT